MNFKSLFSACLLTLFFFSANAQIEVKVNPIGILFGTPDISAEYIVSDNFGVELRIPFNFNTRTQAAFDLTTGELTDNEIKTAGIGAILSARYYFNPDYGADKFYAGGYLKFKTGTGKNSIDTDFDYRDRRVAVGALLGYKWLSAKGISFDFTVGGGRALVSGRTYDNPDLTEAQIDAFELLGNLGKIDFIGSIAVGYRFGG